MDNVLDCKLGRLKIRGSYLEVFCEKSDLENFAIFTGKHLFSKVAGLCFQKFHEIHRKAPAPGSLF